jgi:hypothetical protein
MKTLVIRKGERLTIRAIAFPSEENPARDRCETLAFLHNCKSEHPKEVTKLSALLSETAESGPPKDKTKFRCLTGTDGIYEFKTQFGFRLLCFWDDGGLIICSHGYLKCRQKTPKSELNKAERTKRNYFIAKNNGDLTHAEPRKAIR